MYILKELAKEAIRRVRYSKERSEVIERVGCGKGRGDSSNRYVS